MTGKEFAAKCKAVATDYKTCYVWGTFGWPCKEDLIQRNIKQYPNNAYKYAAGARALIGKGWMFDCVGLIKAILWGWWGKTSHNYGGAAYASNGVPDVSADGMISRCKDVSTNFSEIEVGEVVWLSGHIGVYIGDGLVVECTPAFEGGVQITACKNIGEKAGYSARKWTKHGKLPYVTYPTKISPSAKKPATTAGSAVKVNVPLREIKNGSKGDDVKALQLILNGIGYPCGTADGVFGSKTGLAVEKFQRAKGLTADRIVGANTWKKLLGG